MGRVQRKIRPAIRVVGQFVVTVFGASLLAFIAFRVLLNPVDLLLPVTASEQARASLSMQFGFTDSLPVQYVRFLGGALRGDFGDSLSLRRPALDIVLERLPATAILACAAMGLALIVGGTAGFAAAKRPTSRLDRVVSASSFVGLSMHDAWISIMLILLFAVGTGWFPTGGRTGRYALVLPAIALSVRSAGRMSQIVRTSLVNESGKAYVTTAYAKGASPSRILLSHQLRAAAPAIVTFSMYDFGRLFVGTAIIVETVFAWPGLGQLIVRSLQSGDVFLSQAIVVVSAIIVASLNLTADVIHLALDPRSKSRA